MSTYWVLSEADFLDALRRAHQGESPDLIYAEFFVNADSDHVPPKSE